MKNTSHFIWLELKPEIFSDLFLAVFKYLRNKNLEKILVFQNILSVHLTVYYFEKDLNLETKKLIKTEIKKINLDLKNLENLKKSNKKIFVSGFNYFFRENLGEKSLELKEDAEKRDRSANARLVLESLRENLEEDKNLNKYICYFEIKSDLNLLNYRNIFHEKFNRNFIEDNNFKFIPHVSFFKILDFIAFEKHSKNIEKIINLELKKIKNKNISLNKLNLYSVNSEFREEIQIKI